MNFKKWWALTACLSLCFFLISLVLPVRASAYTYYNDDGFLTVECSNYDFQYDFSLVYDISSPVTNSSVDLPSGYSLVGINVFKDNNTSNIITYVFYPSDIPYTLVDNGTSVSLFRASGFDIYLVNNTLTSSGSRSFRSFQHSNAYNWGSSSRYVAFTPVKDYDGNILLPESTISFDLNVAVSDKVLYFNSAVNSGDGGLVTYYIFPSSANIPSGSVAPVASGSVAVLSPNALERLANKGFYELVGKWGNLAGYNIDDPFPRRVDSSSISSYRFTGGFNPSSFNVPFEKIGTSPLFSSSGITSTNHLNMADIVNLTGGVYAYSNLKLVAVVTLENRDFVASYDFNPSQILNGAPVPPTSLQGTAPYPDFQNPNSDFKELADYLKNLMQSNNENQIRNNSNMLANLMAIPWTNFIGTGFANGFANVMPELSFSLDSLFDSLFDKYSAPSTEQINSLIADVTEERAYIRQKLAFVSDVKQEVFFIQSTFVSAGDNPRPFTVTLPDFMMGNKVHGHQEALVRYDLISSGTRQAMHNVIIVFCSLAVVMHIWRTLPSTVGNMPRD